VLFNPLMPKIKIKKKLLVAEQNQKDLVTRTAFYAIYSFASSGVLAKE
jgi:hypothetical protein